MSFGEEHFVIDKIRKAHLESWYGTLGEQDRIKFRRYIPDSDTSSTFSFFMEVIDKSFDDENYEFTVFLCQSVNELVSMDDYQRFKINEIFIEACAKIGRYDDLKSACETNFKLFERVKADILADNNGVYPLNLNFRNKYIDVIVGVDSNYDLGFQMLEKYREMGLIDEGEFRYRCESLKVHRLQKIFDGVYAYRPTEKNS